MTHPTDHDGTEADEDAPSRAFSVNPPAVLGAAVYAVGVVFALAGLATTGWLHTAGGVGLMLIGANLMAMGVDR